MYNEQLVEKGGIFAVALLLTWTIGRILWFVARRLLNMLDKKDQQLEDANTQRAEVAADVSAALAKNNEHQQRIVRMLDELLNRRADR